MSAWVHRRVGVYPYFRQQAVACLRLHGALYLLKSVRKESLSQPSSKPSHTDHLVPESPTHFYHCIPGLFGKPMGVLFPSLHLPPYTSRLHSSFYLRLSPNGYISFTNLPSPFKLPSLKGGQQLSTVVLTSLPALIRVLEAEGGKDRFFHFLKWDHLCCFRHLFTFKVSRRNILSETELQLM